MKPIPDSCWPYSNDKVACHITNKPLHIVYYAQVKGVRWRGNVGGITGLRYDTTMTDVRVYKLLVVTERPAW